MKASKQDQEGETVKVSLLNGSDRAQHSAEKSVISDIIIHRFGCVCVWVCVREREWVRLRHLRLQVSCPWSATSLFGAFSCSLISPSEVPFSLSVRPIFLPSSFFLLFSLVVLNNGFLLVTLTGDFIVLLWVCLACVWYID